MIEHQGIGNAASGYALGLLNPLSGALIPGRLAAFAREAFDEHLRLWPRLEDESSIDFQGRMMPHLEVVLDERGVPPLWEEMERWNAADGFSARWLDGQGVRALDDRIADDVVGAVLLERLGMVDSQQLTRALMDAACQRGASIVDDRATRITWSGDRAVGVRTAKGEVACHTVVIATGPWSGAVEEWTGLHVPVTPLKGTDRQARRAESSSGVPRSGARRSRAEGGRQALGGGDGGRGGVRSFDHLAGETGPA